MKAKYKNDCKFCILIRPANETSGDLYACPRGSTGTYVLREFIGDSAENRSSTIDGKANSPIPRALLEALRIAVERRLICKCLADLSVDKKGML